MQPQESHSMESRWDRPTLYVTIVSVYLLVSLGMVFSAVTLSYANWAASDTSRGLAILTPIMLFGGLIILGIPSIIGSVGLLRKRKYGVYFSLAALILMTIGLPLSVSVLHNILTNFPLNPGYEATYYAIFFSALVSAFAMYPLLILGWKRVQWK